MHANANTTSPQISAVKPSSFFNSMPRRDPKADEEEEDEERMYFGEEAEVGIESENDDASVSDEETGPTGEPLSKKGRKTLKICRHFAYSLISSSTAMGWEDAEVAQLIALVADQLNFDTPKLIRCLEKTGAGSPSTLSHLIDAGSFSFSVPQLVSVLLSYASNVDHFISVMGEALESDLFDLTSTDTIEVLYSFIENNMDHRESQRYARQLSEHSPSKRVCGKILRTFTSAMTSSEAASYIYDIITLDFFQDVLGTMKDFLNAVGPVREDLEALLDDAYQRDKDGEILDSDADSNGNLKEFVVDSDNAHGNEYSSNESDNNSHNGSGTGSSDSSSSSEDEAQSTEGGTSEDEEEVLQRQPRHKHQHQHGDQGKPHTTSKQRARVVIKDEEGDSDGDAVGSGGEESSNAEEEAIPVRGSAITSKARGRARSEHQAESASKRQRVGQEQMQDADGEDFLAAGDY